MNSELQKKLIKLCGGDVFFDYSVSSLTSIGIGGNANAWIKVTDVETLRQTVDLLKRAGIKMKVIGNASNILVREAGFDGVIIKLSGDFFSGSKIKNNVVTAGGGISLGKLIITCCRSGLGGLEGTAGIPATIGGAVKMNASYKNAVSEKLLRVLILDKQGKYVSRGKEEIEFGYRSSSFGGEEIIVQAEFCLEKVPSEVLEKKFNSYIREKTRNQPLTEKTLGCIFKNQGKGSPSSGELIDKSGMKGARRGAAMVSRKHANFIVNTGGASSGDVIALMEDIQKKVKNVFKINLKPEIEIL
ncbi:MAG: UDP-N-acetylmuramate dehydrogenase [Candidatus Omnitrophica bacterium]|nr:UDP-N-acetylmuramate dehydrogenase [Candidatus Omnitrophota bacterium]